MFHHYRSRKVRITFVQVSYASPLLGTTHNSWFIYILYLTIVLPQARSHLVSRMLRVCSALQAKQINKILDFAPTPTRSHFQDPPAVADCSHRRGRWTRQSIWLLSLAFHKLVSECYDAPWRTLGRGIPSEENVYVKGYKCPSTNMLPTLEIGTGRVHMQNERSM